MRRAFATHGRALVAAACLFVPLQLLAQPAAGVTESAGDAPPPAAEVPPAASAAPAAEKSGRELFEQTCSVCHGLDLPSRQRLDRANWEWVISDMVNLYGCNWTTEQERAKILDYLVENFGRDKPR